MEICSPSQILRREWENMAISLNRCGNLICIKPYQNDIFLDSKLEANSIKMENKILDSGYSTVEASYVFFVLVSKAREHLGLSDEAAFSFASGYSWVRTGYTHFSVSEFQNPEFNKTFSMQLIFYRLFYDGSAEDNWDFDSMKTMERFRNLYNKFREWNNDRNVFERELNIHNKDIKPIKEKLFLTLEGTA